MSDDHNVICFDLVALVQTILLLLQPPKLKYTCTQERMSRPKGGSYAPSGGSYAPDVLNSVGFVLNVHHSAITSRTCTVVKAVVGTRSNCPLLRQ